MKSSIAADLDPLNSIIGEWFETLKIGWVKAIHGVGIDWTFAGEAVEYGGFLVRATAVFVSLGGMLVTALMLGIVSGENLHLQKRCCI